MIKHDLSTWSEPDFSDWWYTGVELVVHVLGKFIVDLVLGSVHTVSSVTPPSVQQETPKQGKYEPGVHVGCVNVHHTISFEGWSWSAPELSALWQWSCFGNETYITTKVPAMFLGTKGSGIWTFPAYMRMYSYLLS